MDETKRPAGWYPDADMPGTQRYWDGDGWTDHVAPFAPVVKVAESERTGTFTIARGVALGLVAVIVLVLLVNQWVTADDELDCSIENAQRSLDGLTSREC